MKKFGEIVEEMFEEAKARRGLSLRGFAKKAGTTATQVQKIFTAPGAKNVQQRTKEKLAQAFQMTVEEFLAEVGRRQEADELAGLPRIEEWIAGLHDGPKLTAIRRIAAAAGMAVIAGVGQAEAEELLAGMMAEKLKGEQIKNRSKSKDSYGEIGRRPA